MSSPISVLLINGPNLNLLGTREPHIYGYETLQNVVDNAEKIAKEQDAVFTAFQSSHEGAIVDRIHQAKKDGVDGIVINPGAYTHTSVAIRDALLGVEIPFIELHVSNPHTREEFRHKSFLVDKAVAVIAGFGTKGYEYAILHVCTQFKKRQQ
ncbi:hypothetical protein PILCRDRAFT_811690 [Piloderma croceum F 1598]|uniref:Catabolic 3-dehydroquinase n=1 Tax=Piloderma croceum (strain F 1598) TaxID=765440 RepID=A0A0C3GHP8_PILCF|nr:hypothetical protein PILCRDRAFT_811690 [Piloderma croceum F 1598]